MPFAAASMAPQSRVTRFPALEAALMVVLTDLFATIAVTLWHTPGLLLTLLTAAPL